MMSRSGLLAAVVLLISSRCVLAGLPPLPPPGPVPAPLLYVQFVAPRGLQVTFYPGNKQVRSFPAPVMVGLRPGYIYRVQLAGFPGYPGVTLYPSLEVRGTLQLPKAT